jgi:hypothetical protein
MLGRRLNSLILWRRCPWGKLHWRWGYCTCINADPEITRRNWEAEDMQASELSDSAAQRNS